jgi:putative SOS response-associated peptidase YedK
MLTYTMITKAAGGDTGAIGHGRQPVMLSPDEYAAWLNPETPIAAFTTRFDPAGTFQARAVKGPKAEAV